MTLFRYRKACLLVSIALFFLVGCAHKYPLLEKAAYTYNLHSSYHIGPGDHLSILVWKNADVTLGVIVRPDGFITLPLVDDVQAAGKTPMVLAEDLEHALAEYLIDPLVTVMVTGFVGTYTDTIRIVGEATQPQSLPYRDGMTVLDLMIIVGGLTDFADGNNTVLVRNYEGDRQTYRVRLNDLLRNGDITANAPVCPGDILIIPEAWF